MSLVNKKYLSVFIYVGTIVLIAAGTFIGTLSSYFGKSGTNIAVAGFIITGLGVILLFLSQAFKIYVLYKFYRSLYGAKSGRTMFYLIITIVPVVNIIGNFFALLRSVLLKNSKTKGKIGPIWVFVIYCILWCIAPYYYITGLVLILIYVNEFFVLYLINRKG